MGRYVMPPAGVKPPSLWGTEERLRALFDTQIAAINVERKNFVFHYQTPQHWIDTFRTCYGPTNKAFTAVDVGKQRMLNADLLRLVQQFNQTTDGAIVVPSEYLEVVIKTRRP